MDEKQVNDEKKSAIDTTTEDGESLKESEKLRFRGFKNDFLGYIGFGSVVITTLLCFVFLGCLVGDYCKCQIFYQIDSVSVQHHFVY
jgi:cation-transporting ATPase 13A3/4/5